MKTKALLMAAVLLAWMGSSSLAQGQSSIASDPNRSALQQLLQELEKKIEEADKRMVAHPRFLEELRALVDRYKASLREIFLKEDFADGDYTRNPTWVVDSGRFRITSERRLASQVAVERPVSPAARQRESSPLGTILGQVLKAAEPRGEGRGSSAEPTEAAIHTLARIDPAFEVELTLVSQSTWGAMEVVLLGGDPPVPRYRMVYRAAASQERPIEIIRERGARSYLIETAARFPKLDDGAPHRVQWMRDSRGRMRVVVDGEEVLNTVELFYQDDFKGLALVNRGGSYEWGPIQVLKAAEGKTQ